MSVRGLLVDLDGTLVDTSEANYAAYAAALYAFGVSIDWEWWTSKAFGRNWRDFLPDVLSGHPDIQPEAVASRKATIYPQHLSLSKLNQGLVDLIATLKPTARTALVTTASRASVSAIQQYHKLEHLFDTVVTGDDVRRHKPSPEGYDIAASRLGLTAAECLVIEDSAVGIAAAQAFGSSYLVVLHGPGTA
jgi:HAD superfamily hydrolase (TIGR01509 family)